MTRENIIKTLVDVEKSLLRAKYVCTKQSIEDELLASYRNVILVGDSLFPGEIDTARNRYSDKTL